MNSYINYILQLLSSIHNRPKMFTDNYNVRQIYSLILGVETEIYPLNYDLEDSFHYLFSLWLYKKDFFSNTFDSFYWYSIFESDDGLDMFKQITSLYNEDISSIKNEPRDDALLKMVDEVTCREKNFVMSDFLHNLESNGEKYINNITVQEINNMISGKTAETKNNSMYHSDLDNRFRFFLFSYVKEYAKNNELYDDNNNYYTLTKLYKLFESNYKDESLHKFYSVINDLFYDYEKETEFIARLKEENARRVCLDKGIQK